jgi:hypothetical protein
VTYWQVLASKGDPGADGVDGANGAAGTISGGTVTTGAAGSSASVTNSGTSSAAVLNFTIPRGNPGTGDVTAANKLSEYTAVANDARLNIGIRQAIQCAASQNLNSLTDPGTYFTVDTSSTNAPAGVADYWMIEAQSMAAFVAGDFAQRATGLTTGYTFSRVCVGNTWSTWKLIGGTISFSNSLASDVALNNTANYFDGPSVNVGNVGTWFVSGTVTVQTASATPATINVRLTDGTTVYASGTISTMSTANNFYRAPLSLSAVITNPAGNVRIQAQNPNVTSSTSINANATGNGKDSTITAVRIG